MRWEDGRESDNVEDDRSSGGGGGFGGGGFGGGGLPFGGGKLGCGGIVLLVVVGLIFGINPLQMLGMVTGGSGPTVQQQTPTDNTNASPNAGTGTVSGPNGSTSAATGAGTSAAPDQNKEFVRHILGSTEDVWGAIFKQAGQTYVQPKLVLYSDSIRSACGGATSAVGPFYCPNDQKVYLDVTFFDLMRQKLGGGGDFAQAYVIAHEVGHHVQKLTGVFDQVQAARQRGEPEDGATGLSVRQELQADCFAGVWAFHAQQQLKWMDPGDADEAIRSAQAIGDDRLQQAGQGYVSPDSFTHGTSAQRVRWFQQGFQSGNPANCDTFKAAQL